MRELFQHLHDHDGVATCDDLRRLGVSWHRERRLLDIGVLDRVGSRVVRVTSTPESFRQRCRIATLGPGRGVISHGAAARLHRLDGFNDHNRVDLLCRRGSWPGHPGVIITHFTRGPVDEAVVDVGHPSARHPRHPRPALTPTTGSPRAGSGQRSRPRLDRHPTARRRRTLDEPGSTGAPRPRGGARRSQPAKPSGVDRGPTSHRRRSRGRHDDRAPHRSARPSAHPCTPDELARSRSRAATISRISSLRRNWRRSASRPLSSAKAR